MISCHNHGFARGREFSPPRCAPHPAAHVKGCWWPTRPRSPCSPLGGCPSWSYLQHLPVELGYQRARVEEWGCSCTASPTTSWCHGGFLALWGLFLG